MLPHYKDLPKLSQTLSCRSFPNQSALSRRHTRGTCCQLKSHRGHCQL